MVSIPQQNIFRAPCWYYRLRYATAGYHPHTVLSNSFELDRATDGGSGPVCGHFLRNVARAQSNGSCYLNWQTEDKLTN
jgi:hypothetical protein